MSKAEVMDTWPEGVTHVSLDVFSINIIRTDEGVVVEVWEKNFEGGEPIAGCYVLESEVEVTNDE